MYEKETRYIHKIVNRYFKSKTIDKAEDEILKDYTDEEAQEKIDRKDSIDSIWNWERENIKFLAENGMMLAGGTINSIFSKREINDLDFYLKDISKLDTIKKELVDTYGYKEVFSSDNAVTFKKKSRLRTLEVQIIKRFSGEPNVILDTFDFTCVQGLFDFQLGEFILSERFLPDLGKRELVYTNTSQYPICALYRTKKYIKRGYHITGANLVALALSIHSLNITTYKDLKDQLMGIDTAMLTELTKDFDDNKSFEVSEFVREWLDIAMDYDSGIN